MFKPQFTCDVGRYHYTGIRSTDTPEEEGWLLVIVAPPHASASVKKWRADLALSKNANVKHICSTGCLADFIQREFSAESEIQLPTPLPASPKALEIPEPAPEPKKVEDDDVPF